MFLLKISCLFIVFCGNLADDKNKWLKFKEDFRKDKSSYEMGINEFPEMLPGELNKNLNWSFTKVIQKRSILPDYVNWVERGYTNPALDQGKCGSCYVLGTVAAIEAQYFIKHNKLIRLSEQDVINCGHLFNSKGCNGGFPVEVFEMVKNRGILFANDEPYKAKDKRCKAKVLETKGNNKPFVKISNYHRLGSGEEELKRAVAEIGPIIVEVEILHSFHFYKKGVYYEPNCKGKPNHIALVVGYGTTKEGEDYWIVRNSWGEDWGKKGHALMSRNRENNCNIAKNPRYPFNPVIMNSNACVSKKKKFWCI